MKQNKWKNIWEERTANLEVLHGNDIKNIIIELKRCNVMDLMWLVMD